MKDTVPALKRVECQWLLNEALRYRISLASWWELTLGYHHKIRNEKIALLESESGFNVMGGGSSMPHKTMGRSAELAGALCALVSKLLLCISIHFELYNAFGDAITAAV